MSEQPAARPAFPSAPALVQDLHAFGHRFLRAAETRRLIEPSGATEGRAWQALADSWNGMPLDGYMADGGRYRRRRFAIFSTLAGSPEIRREPHAAHYQALEYNALNGGIARWFEPIDPDVADGAAFRAILGWCRGMFDALEPLSNWHIEAHQFRIEARAGEPGQPTPEGAHRDGVDWVMVMLVDRVNIASGTTTIFAPDGRGLGSFTLTAPLDVALVDDHRVLHGVTAVEPLDSSAPAHRDVLVVTFRHLPD